MPDPPISSTVPPFAPVEPDVVAIASLRERARDYVRRATAARDLTEEIGLLRSAVLRRDDAAQARHTEDVWSSRAASASRAELQREVGFSLWMAADGLRDTHVALDDHAAYLERESRRLDREADALESGPPPLMVELGVGVWDRTG